MKNLIAMGYHAAYSLYAATFFTDFWGWHGVSRFLSFTALTVNGAILACMVAASGALPIFDVFGGLLSTAFVLGIMGAFFSPNDEGRLNVRTWVWIEALVLFGIALFFPKEPWLHRCTNSYLWAILFHGFRCLALSFALFSAAHFICFRMEPQRQRRRANSPLFHQGRNFLLLAALAFLCGEYAGTIWCQNGWGDICHYVASSHNLLKLKSI